jgi:hypothetical protein
MANREKIVKFYSYIGVLEYGLGRFRMKPAAFLGSSYSKTAVSKRKTK